jgi:hypothetical protein
MISLLIVPSRVVLTAAMKVGVMPSITVGTKTIDQECAPLKPKLRPSVLVSNPSADHNHVFGWISTAGITVAFQHKIILPGFELQDTSRRPFWHLPQVAPADLDIPVRGQLAPAQLPLGDALELGPLEIVGFDAPLGGRPLRE